MSCYLAFNFTVCISMSFVCATCNTYLLCIVWRYLILYIITRSFYLFTIFYQRTTDISQNLPMITANFIKSLFILRSSKNFVCKSLQEPFFVQETLLLGSKFLVKVIPDFLRSSFPIWRVFFFFKLGAYCKTDNEV